MPQALTTGSTPSRSYADTELTRPMMAEQGPAPAPRAYLSRQRDRRSTMKWKLLCACVVGGALVSSGTGSARADGLPVLGVDAGATGVVDARGDARAVTIVAGANTVVAWV